MRPVANVSPSSHSGRSASCWRSDRILGRRRRVDRHVPARAARGDHDLRDRRRLAPDEQRRRAGAPRAQHLRREVACRPPAPSASSRPTPGSRENASSSALAPCWPYVVSSWMQRELQALRDRVLGEPERDAAVGRRDPEDVRPLLEVDEADAAVVGDADRHVRVARDLPGGVDAGAVVDDRDRAVGDRAADVRERLARRERVVVALHLQLVAPSRRRHAGRRSSRSTASSTPRAIVWPMYGLRENGASTAIDQRLRPLLVAAAAAGEREHDASEAAAPARAHSAALPEVRGAHVRVAATSVGRARRDHGARRPSRRPDRRPSARAAGCARRAGSAIPLRAQAREQRVEPADVLERAAGGRLVEQEHARAASRARRRRRRAAARGRRARRRGTSAAQPRPTSASAERASARRRASSARASGVANAVRSAPPCTRRSPAPTRTFSSAVRSANAAVDCSVRTTPTPRALARRRRAEVGAVERGRARRRGGSAREQAQHRRLAGAVRADRARRSRPRRARATTSSAATSAAEALRQRLGDEDGGAALARRSAAARTERRRRPRRRLPVAARRARRTGGTIPSPPSASTASRSSAASIGSKRADSTPSSDAERRRRRR